MVYKYRETEHQKDVLNSDPQSTKQINIHLHVHVPHQQGTVRNKHITVLAGSRDHIQLYNHSYRCLIEKARQGFEFTDLSPCDIRLAGDGPWERQLGSGRQDVHKVFPVSRGVASTTHQLPVVNVKLQEICSIIIA